MNFNKDPEPRPGTFYPEIEEFVEEPFSYPGNFLSYDYVTQITTKQFAVGCTPDTPDTRAVMSQAAEYWTQMANLTTSPFQVTLMLVEYFADEKALEDWARGNNTDPDASYHGGGLYQVGVVFADPLMKTLDYTLRFWTNAVPYTDAPYIEKRFCKSETVWITGILLS